jgi:hypothetical protein
MKIYHLSTLLLVSRMRLVFIPVNFFNELRLIFICMNQGCQMVHFCTKISLFGNSLEGKEKVYFIANWNILLPLGISFGLFAILWSFGIFCGHLVSFVTIFCVMAICHILW